MYQSVFHRIGLASQSIAGLTGPGATVNSIVAGLQSSATPGTAVGLSMSPAPQLRDNVKWKMNVFPRDQKCCMCKRLWRSSQLLSASSHPLRSLSTQVTSDDVSNDIRIRNVGIMAHIDAGKTTTTERMLYYSGFIRRMGDVDDGNTVMDYMKLERERGITINSAAISFDWLDHRINLIDTPGHVDFTFEVERSLRVLDGAVTILDASAGVEAQTLTVWRQASHHGIPRIAFLNKMDKPGASLTACVKSMKDKLLTTPLVTQLPLGVGKDFTGVIDLLTMDLILWAKGGDGRKFTRAPLIPPDPQNGTKDFTKLNRRSDLIKDMPLTEKGLEDALEARNDLAEQVVTLDDQLLELVAEESFDPCTVSDHHLRGGVRRLTAGQLATPTLLGSSLRNIGVQLLMDAIVDYLPSPLETRVTVPEALKDLYAYAFKVSYDRRRGHMVYLRVYSGELKPHTTVYNITRDSDERLTRVLLMMADEQREVISMSRGNIAVAVGMKNTYTGDTIVRSSAAASAAREDCLSSELSLGGLDLPPPVFFCSVEPSTAALQKELDHALSCLSREDPSLRVSTNEDTGQTVLSGMGELHLEIVHDRLTRDYRVDCSLGKLQVAYREAPTLPVTKQVSMDQTIGGKRHTVSCTVTLDPVANNNKVSVQLKTGKSIVGSGFTKTEVLAAVRDGVEGACLQGPILAFPVQNMDVSITSLSLGSATPLTVLSSCVSEGVSRALREAAVQLLEPCTELVVMVTEEHLGTVLSDLSSSRRAQVKEVTVAKDTMVIRALAPLATLVGYSTTLRTMTSGTGSFSATFSHYEPVGRDQEKIITDSTRGY